MYHSKSDEDSTLGKLIEERVAKVLDERIRHNINVNNTVNTVNVNNVNIVINPYGQETLDHLTPEFLTKCVDGRHVKGLIQEIYFNREVPENHNVRYKSAKQQTVEVFGTEGHWIECDKNTTIDDMISRGHKILWLHYLNNPQLKEFSNEEVIPTINKWFQDLGSKNCKEYFELRREVFWMIKDNTLFLFAGLSPLVTQDPIT